MNRVRSGSDTHHRVTEIFVAVRDMRDEERIRHLDEVCHDDAVLRREVESLLEFDTDEATMIDTPVLKSAFDLAATRDQLWDDVARGATDDEPKTIGPYSVVSIIGHGAMGVVYLARQQFTNRLVAVKLVRPHLVGETSLKRLGHEARILGLMKHQGIAQIYDAGAVTVANGQQIFVAMEFVDGPTITRYARENNLSTRQCVELVAQACHAVHHAHQRGVLHRDLKPDNILVEKHGVVKVVDFGVANTLEALKGKAAGRAVGTPPYMSPEQRGDCGEEVDARSDVYALGVILHELLAGSVPAADVTDRCVPDADVATVISTCLADAPDNRYSSAAALAAELERFLTDEPLLARHHTPWYVLRKFGVRHRALAWCLAALLSVATSAAAISLALVRETESRQATMELMRSVIFLVARLPDAGGTRSVNSEDVHRIIDRYFGDDEIAAAEARSYFATLHLRQGRYEEAERGLRAELEILRNVDGEFTLRTLTLKLELGVLLVTEGGSAVEAERHFQEVLSVEPDGVQRMHQLQFRARMRLAQIRTSQHDYESAFSFYRDAEDALAAWPKPVPETELSLVVERALTLMAMGRDEDALAVAREGIAVANASVKAHHRVRGRLEQTLGILLFKAWRHSRVDQLLDEAEAAFVRALEIRSLHLGDDHERIELTRRKLAAVRAQQLQLANAGLRPTNMSTSPSLAR